jgi:phosphohistidine phosphatase SixA
MKNILIIIILSIFFFNNISANERVIDSLKNEGKLIFIRHAHAPGGGDPNNFNIRDCKTQRNLDLEGIIQAKKIGNFFKDNNIPIDQVLSSEWCRCKDTAINAFGNYKIFNALNSFFSLKFAKNKDKQIRDLKFFVKKWDSKKNIVFITHYVVISEVLNESVNSGTIIVTDKNFKVIGTIKTN